MSENDPQVFRPTTKARLTSIDTAKVSIDETNKVTVDFRIQDLVRQLVPDGDLAASCGGCNGCSGCSM